MYAHCIPWSSSLPSIVAHAAVAAEPSAAHVGSSFALPQSWIAIGSETVDWHGCRAVAHGRKKYLWPPESCTVMSCSSTPSLRELKSYVALPQVYWHGRSSLVLGVQGVAPSAKWVK